MNGRRSDEASTAAQLDREIDQMLTIDPSPEFVARVRSRIAAGSRPSFWSFRPVALIACSAALALIVLARLEWRRAVEQPLSVDPFAEIAARPVAAPLVALWPAQATPVRIPPQRFTGHRHSRIAGEPEVIVAPDEVAAIHRLIAAWRGRELDVSPLRGSSTASASASPLIDTGIKPLAQLSPITVQPLGPLVGE